MRNIVIRGSRKRYSAFTLKSYIVPKTKAVIGRMNEDPTRQSSISKPGLVHPLRKLAIDDSRGYGLCDCYPLSPFMLLQSLSAHGTVCISCLIHKDREHCGAYYANLLLQRVVHPSPQQGLGDLHGSGGSFPDQILG